MSLNMSEYYKYCIALQSDEAAQRDRRDGHAGRAPGRAGHRVARVRVQV